MAGKDQVIALHHAYPHWNARELAAALGCGVAYVKAAAKRERLILAKRPSDVMRHERCRRLTEALDSFLELDETVSAEEFINARRRVSRALAFCPDPEVRYG